MASWIRLLDRNINNAFLGVILLNKINCHMSNKSDGKIFDKNEFISSYFEGGRSCICDAKFLFDNRKISHFNILLLHGIELLFKSFILLKDESASADGVKDEFGHNCLKTYARCKELNSEPDMFGDDFEKSLHEFLEYHSSNIMIARYPDKAKLQTFFIYEDGKTIFDYIEERVIGPMDPLVRGIFRI